MGLRRRGLDGPKFRMREKMMAIGDDYWIEDDDGNKLYKVNGKAARLRETFILEDAQGNELSKIQEKKLTVRDKMTIEWADSHATVRKRLPLIVALAAALLLTSCGGDSDDAGGGSASGSADVLRVGTEGTYAPFSFHDPSSNELTGYDVEVAQAVGAELGIEVEFSETQFDAIFAGLEADRYDVIANQVTITPEREEKYLFSAPYTVSNGVVITRADDDSVRSLADVKGKRSAQSTTSSFAEVATEAGAQVEPVEGFTHQKTTGDKDVKIAAEIDPPSKQALVFRKDSADLQARVDKAIEALRADGTLARISEKYFGEDVSGE